LILLPEPPPPTYDVDRDGNGSGTITSKNGDSYSGEIRGWKRHGFGVQTWHTGETYRVPTPTRLFLLLSC
jgi:hypothetical protein